MYQREPFRPAGTDAASYEHDPLTERINGCAIAVHRVLGPGLMERSYERVRNRVEGGRPHL
jgi:hypothetical protein